MGEEFIKIQTWQVMCGVGKSIEEAKAEYAYFNEIYKYKGDFTDYLISMRAVQFSYLVDATMYIEDRLVLIEGMLFANKALSVLENDDDSVFLTTKERIKQIKDVYKELKQSDSIYSEYDEFDDYIFKKGIKKYVKRYCKNNK